jgi:crotonobetainyl-CoA:carnitine CoA-transferase CaiB-like acyl-CoA transferase
VAGNSEHAAALLQLHDLWWAKVLNWAEFLCEEALLHLGMLQRSHIGLGTPLCLNKPPLRVNGSRATSTEAAPKIGLRNDTIRFEYKL